MSLIQLIYVSAATIELSDEELAKVLESSVRHNKEQGVTGMLLYAGGNFIQVLEGEAAAIDETMSRIERDPRHFQLIVLERSPVAEREFGNWYMGFRHLNEAEIADPSFVPFCTHQMAPERMQVKPGVALELLRHFVEMA